MSIRAASRVQLFASAGNGGRIMRCGIISSCQSAATSDIVKALLGMCHRVSIAIVITGPYKF